MPTIKAGLKAPRYLQQDRVIPNQDRVIPNEVRDLGFAGATPLPTSPLGGAALQRCDKNLKTEQRLQPPSYDSVPGRTIPTTCNRNVTPHPTIELLPPTPCHAERSRIVQRTILRSRSIPTHHQRSAVHAALTRATLDPKNACKFQLLSSAHCNFAYSALASFRMGISGSAAFQRVRKSWYAAFALAVSPAIA